MKQYRPTRNGKTFELMGMRKFIPDNMQNRDRRKMQAELDATPPTAVMVPALPPRPIERSSGELVEDILVGTPAEKAAAETEMRGRRGQRGA